MPTIIGFAGRMYNGKSTVAKMFEEILPNAERMAFADALKDMCCKILNCDRKTLDEMKSSGKRLLNVYRLDTLAIISEETGIPEEKIAAVVYGESFGNVRTMLQTLGTDVLRRYDKDWHVRKIISRIEKSTADFILIDDVRFYNEKRMIEDLNGTLFFVKRNIENEDNHASETSLSEFFFPRNNIIYNTTIEETMEVVKELSKRFLSQEQIFMQT